MQLTKHFPYTQGHTKHWHCRRTFWSF